MRITIGHNVRHVRTNVIRCAANSKKNIILSSAPHLTFINPVQPQSFSKRSTMLHRHILWNCTINLSTPARAHTRIEEYRNCQVNDKEEQCVCHIRHLRIYNTMRTTNFYRILSQLHALSVDEISAFYLRVPIQFEGIQPS